MKEQFFVGIKFNNIVYKCELDGKWHNKEQSRPEVIAKLTGITQTPTGEIKPEVVSMLICSECYKNSELKLKDPSGIIITPTLPKQK